MRGCCHSFLGSPPVALVVGFFAVTTELSIILSLLRLYMILPLVSTKTIDIRL